MAAGFDARLLPLGLLRTSAPPRELRDVVRVCIRSAALSPHRLLRSLPASAHPADTSQSACPPQRQAQRPAVRPFLDISHVSSLQFGRHATGRHDVIYACPTATVSSRLPRCRRLSPSRGGQISCGSTRSAPAIVRITHPAGRLPPEGTPPNSAARSPSARARCRSEYRSHADGRALSPPPPRAWHGYSAETASDIYSSEIYSYSLRIPLDCLMQPNPQSHQAPLDLHQHHHQASPLSPIIQIARHHRRPRRSSAIALNRRAVNSARSVAGNTGASKPRASELHT